MFDLLTDLLTNAHNKEIKLIHHGCLPNLMLLYAILTYLMLFAALSNAVCLYNAVSLHSA